jgi:methylamine dehydrogenase heavy chain
MRRADYGDEGAGLMNFFNRQWLLSLMLAAGGVGLTGCTDSEPQVKEEVAKTTVIAEFTPEPTGTVASLPTQYPEHWAIIHDASFFHMLEGKYLVVDPLGKDVGTQLRGMITGSFMAGFAQSADRGEHYVAESFFSRGGRGGERTDVLTIWDRQSLEVLDEVILPGGKKLQSMPQKYSVQVIDGGRLLLVYNFTPAASVTVVDLDQRAVVDEVQIAGCAMVFPLGQRGFMSLCSDGGYLASTLDAAGKSSGSTRGEPFFDEINDPLFTKPIINGGTAHFPSFLGNVVSVDVSGDAPVVGNSWSLTSDAERKEGWRPGGWQLTAGDDNGMMYVLMHPEGRDGSHKDGGSEVWVYDLKQRQRVSRFALETWGVSLAATRGSEPLLLVTNAEMKVDVYRGGKFVRTLAVETGTPFLVHPAR